MIKSITGSMKTPTYYFYIKFFVLNYQFCPHLSFLYINRIIYNLRKRMYKNTLTLCLCRYWPIDTREKDTIFIDKRFSMQMENLFIGFVCYEVCWEEYLNASWVYLGVDWTLKWKITIFHQLLFRDTSKI